MHNLCGESIFKSQRYIMCNKIDDKMIEKLPIISVYMYVNYY